MSVTTRPLRALAEVHLGRQRSPEHADGPNMVPYLRAANVTDGAIDVSDVKEMNFSPKEQSFFRLRDGDILVTEGSGSIRTVGASGVWRAELPGTVCFQNTLLRLRPRADSTDARYLAWWCRYAFSDGIFASVSSGANIFHLSAERLRALPIAAPSLENQRRIADYLDAETARLDALAVRTRQMIDLIRERESTSMEAALFASSPAYLSVRRVADRVTSGSTPPGGAASYPEFGVTFIRSQNINNNNLIIDDVAFIDAQTHREMARTQVREGDVLLTISGASIGRSAVARLNGQEANVNQHVCIIRLKDGFLPEFVQSVMSLPFVQQQIFGVQVGGNRQGLTFEDVRELRLPIPSDIPVQRLLLEKLSRIRDTSVRTTNALRRQADLFEERKRTLITAAVTGQLDDAGVAA